MSRMLFIAAAVAAYAGSAGAASACTDPSNRRSYFSYDRPALTGDSVQLLVSISPEEIRTTGSIRAQLLSGERGVSNDGYVRIRLGEAAVGENCVDLGPTEGPVFVVGALKRSSRGELLLMADARRQSPAPIFRRGQRDPSFYDQFVVDPAYLSPEERRRRQEGRNDRP